MANELYFTIVKLSVAILYNPGYTDTMNNATNQVRCIKCPNTSPGYLPWFNHRHGGVCFTCEGTGFVDAGTLPETRTAAPFRASLDFKVQGETFRAYAVSLTAETGEIVIIRPDVCSHDEDYHVGALWFRADGTSKASEGMRYPEIAELPIEDKRAIMGAALAVYRASR